MRYVHTNIVARDWRKLAEFYKTVFQCREKPPERAFSGAWLDRATGLTDAALEGVHLHLPGYGDNGPTLEIFSYADMMGSGESAANKYGFSHIAFEVDDVKTTYVMALEKGGKELGKVAEKQVPGIGTLIFVYFKDQEGNIVEIQSWEKDC